MVRKPSDIVAIELGRSCICALSGTIDESGSPATAGEPLGSGVGLEPTTYGLTD